MALLDDRDLSPEVSSPVADDIRAAFYDVFVGGPAPEEKPFGSAETFAYDHKTFMGEFTPPGATEPSQFVLLEASEVAGRNANMGQKYRETRLARDRFLPDHQSFLFVTTDGERICEWQVAHAYWRTSGAVPEGELVMQIMRPREHDWRYKEGGEVRLSYKGGVIRLPHQKEASWLIGQGIFAEGPQFLADPAQTAHNLYNGNNDESHRVRLLRSVVREQL